MKKIFPAISAVVLLLFTSCKVNVIEDRVDVTVHSSESGDGTVILDPMGETFSMEVLSTVPCKLVEEIDWIDEEQATGTDGVFSFAASRTPLTVERSGEISFVYNNYVNRTITVVQKARADGFKVTVKHSDEKFAAPVVNGWSTTGTLDWGDGNNQKYSTDISHIYGAGAENTVTADVFGGETISIQNIGKIQSINVEYQE